METIFKKEEKTAKKFQRYENPDIPGRLKTKDRKVVNEHINSIRPLFTCENCRRISSPQKQHESLVTYKFYRRVLKEDSLNFKIKGQADRSRVVTYLVTLNCTIEGRSSYLAHEHGHRKCQMRGVLYGFGTGHVRTKFGALRYVLLKPAFIL